LYKIISTNRGNLTSSFLICIPFISFSCLNALRIQALYWIRVGRVDTLVSLLILEEMVSVFPHSVWYWLWVRHIYLYVKVWPSFWRVFIMKGCWTYQRRFLHLLKWSCYYCPQLNLCAVLHYCFSHVKALLHPWNGLLNMLLNLVYK
jgi:hypothetical protein